MKPSGRSTYCSPKPTAPDRGVEVFVELVRMCDAPAWAYLLEVYTTDHEKTDANRESNERIRQDPERR